MLRWRAALPPAVGVLAQVARPRRRGVLLEDVRREAVVPLGVARVEEDEHEVEAAQQRRVEGDVHAEGEVVAVLAARVRCGDDGGARVELGDHPRLGDRDALLLHRLVDRGPVSRAHRRELVDAAHAAVGEDERARLERPLAARLAHRRDGQPDAARPRPAREDVPGVECRRVAEQLAFPEPGLADEEEVGVPADAHPALLAVLLPRVALLFAPDGNAPDERERERELGEAHPAERRAELGEQVVASAQRRPRVPVPVVPPRDLHVPGHLVRSLCLALGADVVGDDDRFELRTLPGVVARPADTDLADDVDRIPGLARVGEVVREDDGELSGNAAGRERIALLHSEFLDVHRRGEDVRRRLKGHRAASLEAAHARKREPIATLEVCLERDLVLTLGTAVHTPFFENTDGCRTHNGRTHLYEPSRHFRRWKGVCRVLFTAVERRKTKMCL